MISWTDQIQFVATGSYAYGFSENLVLWYVLVWEGVNVGNVCCNSFDEIIFISSGYELFHQKCVKTKTSPKRFPEMTVTPSLNELWELCSK